MTSKAGQNALLRSDSSLKLISESIHSAFSHTLLDTPSQCCTFPDIDTGATIYLYADWVWSFRHYCTIECTVRSCYGDTKIPTINTNFNYQSIAVYHKLYPVLYMSHSQTLPQQLWQKQTNDHNNQELNPLHWQPFPTCHMEEASFSDNLQHCMRSLLSRQSITHYTQFGNLCRILK